jgi:hypothetical protein
MVSARFIRKRSIRAFHAKGVSDTDSVLLKMKHPSIEDPFPD